MSQQTLLMYAAVGVAILVAINVAMRVLRAVIRIAVVAAVVMACLGWGGSAAKTLTGLRDEVERAASVVAAAPVATNSPTRSAQDRAIATAVAGVVSQARADASSVRVSQTCQGGRRVVVVRYQEPGFPFGLGRPETLTVDAAGGCAAAMP